MLMDMPLDKARATIRWGRRKITDLRLGSSVGAIDAFLVSYPKSGRTWLRYLLSYYLAKLYDVPVDVDLSTTFKILPNFDFDAERGLPAFERRGAAGRLPLIAVSHRDYDPRFFGDKPVVMLVRDPRDVCVSAYFHETRHKLRFNGSMHDFISDGRFGIPAIIRYHNGWADGLIPGTALIVSYEELSRDIRGAVRRMLAFLEIPQNEALLDQAVERAAFDRMKQDEKTVQIPGHAYDPGDADSGRVRKGKVGGYAEYLSDSDLDQIASILRNGLSERAAALISRSGFQV